MDSSLILKNFNSRIKSDHQKKLKKYLKEISNNNWPKFLDSFKKNYHYDYKRNFLKKYNKYNNVNVIGMGGSSLGSKAIYNFLNYKIKKKFNFFENLNLKKNNKKKSLNLIISKSGNTLETIVNSNIILSSWVPWAIFQDPLWNVASRPLPLFHLQRPQTLPCLPWSR